MVGHIAPVQRVKQPTAKGLTSRAVGTLKKIQKPGFCTALPVRHKTKLKRYTNPMNR